ncbi:MAG: hypothetical protein ACRDSJ_01080 [Rubrobacteraceae bacterium]
MTDTHRDSPKKTLDDALIADFAGRFRGEVITPDSPNYDEVRASSPSRGRRVGPTGAGTSCEHRRPVARYA